MTFGGAGGAGGAGGGAVQSKAISRVRSKLMSLSSASR
ncbi:hypothetical protein ACIPQB_11280 [Caulobacter sp. LARHSG274]